jgi:protein arginine N-methyltransferase 1
MDQLLDFDRTLLSDRAGQEAFRQAIFDTVKPGDVVLDLGTGTGLHALFACQAGARKVYAIEQHAIIELARQICRANGYADRVQFIHSSAAQADIPEQVDIIVAHHGPDTLLELLPDARDRFLKPGGTIIPASITWFCAPLETPEAYARYVGFWDSSHYDLTFAMLHAPAINTRYRRRIGSDELLGQPAELVCFDFLQVREPSIAANVEVEISRPGLFHGVGIWWTEWLTSEIVVSAAPPCDLSIDLWGNWFLPIATPTPVELGDTASISIDTGAGGWGNIWSWRVAIRDRQGGEKARFAHSTFASMLLPRERLRKQALDFAPGLSPRGAAMRFVLECCDGARTLREIEEAAAHEFPELFRRDGEAAAFVADVVGRYSM